MPEDKPDKPKSEAFQNFEKLAKGLFAVPKAELDALEKEESQKARKRTESKTKE